MAFTNPWGNGMFGMPGQSVQPGSVAQQPDYGSRFGAPAFPLRNPPPTYGSRRGWPMLPFMSPPNYPQLPGQGGMFGNPQMSDEFRTTDRQMPVNRYQAPGIDPGRNMMAEAPGFTMNQRFDPGQQAEAPGFMVNQRQDQPPGGMATTGNTPIAGMSAAALNDPYLPAMYRKQLQEQGIQSASTPNAGQPQQPNFWQNTGVGTQQIPGYGNPAWGPQTYGFDPRSMAGKTVGQDMAWYYGQDAVGRPVNAAGDAYAQFRSPADGFQRTRPWY